MVDIPSAATMQRLSFPQRAVLNMYDEMDTLRDGTRLNFRIVLNDGDPQHMTWLIRAKNIFSQQLPKMPREYICRLVLDRRHRSLVALKGDRVVGAICYRPFQQQHFAEIAFLAVTSSEQVKGYGTRLMRHLKECLKSRGITEFLTYADNFAIGYFKKQGFTKSISMDKRRWVGYIKDYDGGTLMQCTIHPRMQYLKSKAMILRQKQFLMERMRKLGVLEGAGVTMDAAGVVKVGDRPLGPWPGSRLDPSAAQTPRQREQLVRELQQRLMAFHDRIAGSVDAWPFAEPVTPEEAPDYHKIIHNPMDLSTIGRRLANRHYKSIAAYRADLDLMFRNCFAYNPSGHNVYDIGKRFQAEVTKRLASEEIASALGPGGRGR